MLFVILGCHTAISEFHLYFQHFKISLMLLCMQQSDSMRHCPSLTLLFYVMVFASIILLWFDAGQGPFLLLHQELEKWGLYK